MMRIVPKEEQDIIDKVRKEIKRLLAKICDENNMRYVFMRDSQSIQSSVDSIAKRMGRLKVTTKKRMTEEELKESKKLVDMIEERDSD